RIKGVRQILLMRTRQITREYRLLRTVLIIDPSNELPLIGSIDDAVRNPAAWVRSLRELFRKFYRCRTEQSRIDPIPGERRCQANLAAAVARRRSECRE